MFGYDKNYIEKQLNIALNWRQYETVFRDDALRRIASHINLIVPPNEFTNNERDFIKKIALLVLELSEDVGA